MIISKKAFIVLKISILILAFFLVSIGSSCGRKTGLSDDQYPDREITGIEEQIENDTTDAEGSFAQEPSIVEATQDRGTRIGASAVTEPSRLTTDVAVVEARHMNGREANFWEVIDISLENDLYIIANIIIGKAEGMHLFAEDDWRARVEDIANELIRRGANRKNARITIDNEPMKYLTREEYVDYVNIAYDQIDGRLDMGAGNEEYDLAMRSNNMYEYLAQNADFDVLDIHIQSSMTTPESIHEKGDWFRDLAAKHDKRLSVTEANWFDVSVPEGYNMLIMQLEKAIEIGAEDFSVVFVSLRDRPQYEWLSFIYNGNIRNEETWHDFRQRMLESKEVT